MIDARGYSCPEPVIMVKKAMETKDTAYDVLVDNRAAVENITRFVTHSGYAVDVQSEGDDFRLHITKK